MERKTFNVAPQEMANDVTASNSNTNKRSFERNSENYRKGMALFKKLHGAHAGEDLVNNLIGISPDFVDMTIEWAIQGIMSRPGLDLLSREYLLIASCTTLGHAQPQLRAHIEAAINLSGTKDQIIEVILQMIFYAGGANVSNALATAKQVFEENELLSKID